MDLARLVGHLHKPDGEDGCWLWRAGKIRGYGYTTFDGRTQLAHRVMWQLVRGPITSTQRLDHLCHPGDGSCPGGADCPHRSCCNPAHLAIATDRENILRGVGPTAVNARKTECLRGHPLDEQNTVMGADGHRRCKTCRRTWRHRARHVSRSTVGAGAPRV